MCLRPVTMLIPNNISLLCFEHYSYISMRRKALFGTIITNTPLTLDGPWTKELLGSSLHVSEAICYGVSRTKTRWSVDIQWRYFWKLWCFLRVNWMSTCNGEAGRFMPYFKEYQHWIFLNTTVRNLFHSVHWSLGNYLSRKILLHHFLNAGCMPHHVISLYLIQSTCEVQMLKFYNNF